MGRPLFLVLMLAALALAACSSPPADQASGASTIVALTPSEDEQASPTPEGVAIEYFELITGDCFNEYLDVTDPVTGAVQNLMTQVDCRRPHDGEIYAELTHPASANVPYPSTTELARWAALNCYDNFAEFVGTEYELSELEIGYLVPEESNWVGGLYRTVACYLHAEDDQLSGPMQGSSI